MTALLRRVDDTFSGERHPPAPWCNALGVSQRCEYNYSLLVRTQRSDSRRVVEAASPKTFTARCKLVAGSEKWVASYPLTMLGTMKYDRTMAWKASG
jgi:hypothetical protein